MKLKDIAWRLGRLGIEACGDAIGAFGEHVVAPFVMGTIKYEFVWRHPNASREAIRLRMKQEEAIILAKLNHMGEVKIRKVEPRRYYYNRKAFAVYLEDLIERMESKGATREETEPMREMAYKYRCTFNDAISTNNLRWIHKMENKYGVEEK